jgi:two-component SAPR family response regulator
MPGIDGIETIKRARELRPQLICFLATGYANELAMPLDGNIFTLLRKPLATDKLARQIEAAIKAVKL